MLKLTQTRKELSKLEKQKISERNQQFACTYTHYKQSKDIILDKTPFITALRKRKCLDISLLRNVQNLYKEHFKMCLNDT